MKQSETVNPKHHTVLSEAAHRRPVVWFSTWECDPSNSSGPPSQTGPSSSDSDDKTCSRVSMRRGWIPHAQPVLVMAAVAGQGDTGLIIWFLHAVDTQGRDGAHKGPFLSTRQGQCRPVCSRPSLFVSSCTWKWGRKDSTSCTSSLFHTATQAVACLIVSLVHWIMAIIMDYYYSQLCQSEQKWIQQVCLCTTRQLYIFSQWKSSLQDAMLFIVQEKPTKNLDELSSV